VSDALKFHAGMPGFDLAAVEGKVKADPVEAAKQFEGLMIQMMVKEMRRTLPDSGLMGSDHISMYEDFFDQVISDRIAEGSGLGLAAQLAGSTGVSVGSSAEPSSVARVAGSPSVSLPTSLNGGRRRAPLPVFGRISSSFGHRHDPIDGKHRHHDGIDFAAPTGAPIQPVRSGVVTRVGDMGSYGKVVFVDHGEGVETRYAHCSEILVEEGARVRPGMVIARVGSTGRSTGPHLHFESRKDGSPIDPGELFGWKGEKGLK